MCLSLVLAKPDTMANVLIGLENAGYTKIRIQGHTAEKDRTTGPGAKSADVLVRVVGPGCVLMLIAGLPRLWSIVPNSGKALAFALRPPKDESDEEGEESEGGKKKKDDSKKSKKAKKAKKAAKKVKKDEGLTVVKPSKFGAKVAIDKIMASENLRLIYTLGCPFQMSGVLFPCSSTVFVVCRTLQHLYYSALQVLSNLNRWFPRAAGSGELAPVRPSVFAHHYKVESEEIKRLF